MGDDGRKRGKPAIGIIGVVAAIASIWWFAFRPRHGGEEVILEAPEVPEAPEES